MRFRLGFEPQPTAGRMGEVGSEGRFLSQPRLLIFLLPFSQAKLQGHVEPLRKHLEAVQKMKAKEERRVTELKVGECPGQALTGSVVRAGKMGCPPLQVVTRSPEEGQLRPERGRHPPRVLIRKRL